MRAVVTGVAGFVGSHLAEALTAAGNRVIGIDCLTDYYSPEEKWANIETLRRLSSFELVTDDLRSARLEELIEGADVVFHQAGQPGVRRSWADGFGDYCGHNVLATQRLLEAAKSVGCPRLVYASSSSVYGEAPAFPTTEQELPRPHSPYGVTKLAAEHLCGLYAANWGLSSVALRYFTVYGPRQRPDMAIRRLVDAAVTGTVFPLFGNGEQVRDFTYVRDVVAANLLAGEADVKAGTVLNIAGGSKTTLRKVLYLVGDLAGRSVAIEHRPSEAGDVSQTAGAIDEAYRLLGWEPRVPLRDGLAAEVAWSMGRHSTRTLVPDALPA